MGKIHSMCLPLLTLVVCPEGFQGLNDVLDGGIRTLRTTNGLQAIKGLDPVVGLGVSNLGIIIGGGGLYAYRIVGMVRSKRKV